MSKWIKLAAVVCALSVFAGGVQAQLGDVQYVAAAFNFGFLANYESTPPALTWSGGDEATVYTTGGYSYDFGTVTIDMIFGGMTDLNIGGPRAEAVFTTVTSSTPNKWTLMMGDCVQIPGLTISLEGSLLLNGSPWAGYHEKEEAPETNLSHLLGKAWVTVDSYSINGITGLDWDMNNNDRSGIIASTTLTQNIDDYQTDWSSGNVLLQIWTDENYVVPEPATLGLLGLGGGLLFWRRKHA